MPTNLTPMTGEANDRVLAVEVGTLGNAQNDGNVLQQRDYVNDSNYKDEWYIWSGVNIGMSTDNYTDDTSCPERQSYRYANKFYDMLTKTSGGEITKIHHYNMGETRTASINDFAANGAIYNDLDFMIFIGHGLTATDERGNHFHYSCSVDGQPNPGSCSDDGYNIYTSTVRFGAPKSKLRWAWLYTCNFLTGSDFVKQNDLKALMNGAHIVLGYCTKSTLCDAMAEKFAEYLRSGMPICEAYFEAGVKGEGEAEKTNHTLRIVCTKMAQSETIYTPYMSYDYTAEDIIIYQKCTRKNCATDKCNHDDL